MVHAPTAVPAELDFSLLPDELRHFAPLITRHAESDDVVRSDLLEHASGDELPELSEASTNDWDATNRFLDEHVDDPPGPIQNMALALDSFAQAAMEAKLELDACSA